MARRPRLSRAAIIKANRERIEAELPGLLEYLEPWLPDFDDQLAALVWPRWKTPPPTTEARAAGAHFRVDAVHRFLLFCSKLRHIKGRKFAGKAFIPDLWQIVHVVGPVFGWHGPDGTRLYRELFLEVPRKNGKSTLVAAIGLYLLTADGEAGAEVYSVAKDKDQARAVWAVGALMAKAAPALRRRLRIPPRPLERGERIVYERTSSVWTLLAKDVMGDKHHGYNIHGALVDELHTITDAELIGTIETGTGSRDQPLTVIITTAGIESRSPIWVDKRGLIIRLSEGTVTESTIYGAIFAADPEVEVDGTWDQERVWRGANPGFGRSVQPDYLRRMAAKAKASPTELSRFLRLHLGVPTESASSYIELPTWDRSAGLVLEDDLEGAECWGGMDLASSRDLAAFMLVFPAGDGALDVVTRVWTPADTLVARAQRDRADYVRWARDGYLLTTPGETISYDDIEDEVRRLAQRYKIQAVNFDRWGAKQLREHLESAGVELWEMGQGFASMSPPMKELERYVLERRIRHGGHPVLRYCASGLVAGHDPAGNVKPDRKRSTSRIDAMAALIMALDAYIRREPENRSVYEDRDLEVLA
jgi:phage terminase large subunit-like protein